MEESLEGGNPNTPQTVPGPMSLSVSIATGYGIQPAILASASPDKVTALRATAEQHQENHSRTAVPGCRSAVTH